MVLTKDTGETEQEDVTETVQIVLAAGRSERMGSPKPLLDFGGRTALSVVVETAAAAGVDRHIVVLGAHSDAVREAHPFAHLAGRVDWAYNRVAGSEQLESLKAALRSLEADPPDAFFIQPVDCPLAEPEDYGLLLAEAALPEAASAEVFILSHDRRRGHPLLCRWPLASRFLALPQGSTAREVIESSAIRYVVTPNSGVLEDMDTPEDYERLAEIVRARQRKG